MSIRSFMLTAVLSAMISCDKASNEEKLLNIPKGKWESAAFMQGESWMSDPMPHFFTFNEDGNFIFRDHNAADCNGTFIIITPINSYSQVHFNNQTCGLTDRKIESLSTDTLVMSVITPPNITKDLVKYKRQQ